VFDLVQRESIILLVRRTVDIRPKIFNSFQQGLNELVTSYDMLIMLSVPP